MAGRSTSRGVALGGVRLATVRIASLAAGGDGVGRVDGLAVFVPRSAPGDLVDVELQQEGRLARGRIVALRERSPDRVDPPCPHYEGDRCGGCQLQHVREDVQRAAKGSIVQDALQRIGRVAFAVAPAQVPPSSWRYRISLTLALRRDAPGRSAPWRFGLRHYDDPERVFDLEDCLITDERIVALWREIRAHARHLPNAVRLRGTVRWMGDAAALSLVGGARWPQDDVLALAAACPSLSVIYWTPEGGPRHVLFDRRPDAALPAVSFTQINPAVAAALRADVTRRALAHAPRRAIDAYSGAGDVGVALAQAGVAVTAIEVDREAAAWAARRLTPPSRSVAARVEQSIERALPADVVLLNPPRAGIDERVARALDRATPPPSAIIYASCNPATLARDIARLPSFAVAAVELYDMFPQTAHVETVCELVPRA